MARVTAALRRHRHFVVVVTILIVVMTFPTIVYVFEPDIFWLPTGNHGDTWMKVWDAWYGKRILAGQGDYYFTDLVFYPTGASLVFHNFSIPHMLVFGGLQAIMPLSNAYSLTFLLIVAAVTCSAYVYMLYLFKDKWIALLGAVIIGLSPHVVGYPEHPEYRFIATVPLAMYFLHRGLVEWRIKLVFCAAALTGLTAYVSMHVTVCLVVMLAMFFLYFLASSWRERSFWAAAVVFATVPALISAPRVAPMVASASALESAVASHREVDNDLLEYFINPRHPLTNRLFSRQLADWRFSPTSSRYSSYLGYAVLLLIGFGLLTKGCRRRMIPWLIMALPFLLLRLGSYLRIGGVEYPHILLPKHYLDDLLPAVTEGFRVASAFHLGALIPLAILACIGASAIIQRIPPPPRVALFVLAIIGVVCFENFQPVRQGVVSANELAFLDWLADEPVDARLVNLPMNNSWMKVLYSFHQTQKGFPHADGAIARRPPEAYNYIKGNYLLYEWKYGGGGGYCTHRNRTQHIQALDQLATDGFTHLVVHKKMWWKPVLGFIGIRSAYEDDYVTIYRMDELRTACDTEHMAAFFSPFPYAEIYLMPSIVHERNGFVVSFHRSQSADEAFVTYFSDISFDEKNLLHFTYSGADGLDVQGPPYARENYEAVIGANNGIWLVNNPQATDLSQMPVFRDWLAPNYRFCRSFLDRADATIDLYLKPNIPCAALDDQSKFDVLYDGGARLHNLSYDLAADRMTFYLAWTIDAEREYSFSIQLYDEAGRKAAQYDNSVFRDVVNVHSVDLSQASGGAYDMKLILYDPETGASYSGTMVDGSMRFERALDIGRVVVG